MRVDCYPGEAIAQLQHETRQAFVRGGLSRAVESWRELTESRSSSRLSVRGHRAGMLSYSGQMIGSKCTPRCANSSSHALARFRACSPNRVPPSAPISSATIDRILAWNLRIDSSGRDESFHFSALGATFPSSQSCSSASASTPSPFARNGFALGRFQPRSPTRRGCVYSFGIADVLILLWWLMRSIVRIIKGMAPWTTAKRSPDRGRDCPAYDSRNWSGGPYPFCEIKMSKEFE